MIKALIAPYLGWIYGAAVVAVVGAGVLVYGAIYDRGWDARDVKAKAEQQSQLDANDRAIFESGQKLRNSLATLYAEKERLQIDVDRLNEDADQDAAANTGGLKRSSVQRLNAIK